MLDAEALVKTEHTEKVSQQTLKASNQSEPKEKQSSQVKKASEARHIPIQLVGATFKIEPFDGTQANRQMESPKMTSEEKKQAKVSRTLLKPKKNPNSI